MSTSITARQWTAVRTALLDSTDHFAELSSSCDPAVMATREWTVADTAAHVTAIALWDTALARLGEVVFPYPWSAVTDQIEVTTVDTVYQLNDEILGRFTEREPQVLAKQLQAHVSDMMTASASLDPDSPVPWLGGSRIPLAALFAHMTNELQIHGRDIARATGRRWSTPPEYAAQFFEIFVAGVTRHGVGRLLYREGGATSRRIVVQFVLRHGSAVTLLLDHGIVTLAEDDLAVDARVRADPATLNLMLFGRVSQLHAVLSGKVMVAGRRPWLLPAFRRMVRFPS